MSKSIPISVKATIVVNASPEAVWDYTQNWQYRREWDSSVVEVIKIEDSPSKNVRARFKGGVEFLVQYKIGERPLRTGLAMIESNSQWMVGGGGSWQYKSAGNSTEWCQQNTIVFRNHFLIRFFGPVIKLLLQASTLTNMKKAKGIIEARTR